LELFIVIQLTLSWILLYIFCRKNLLVLGLTPLTKRVFQVMIGFLSFGVICTIILLIDSTLTNTQWKLNPDLTYQLILNLLWWDTKSVIFEELLFRGALLYIAIHKLGARKGIILSAIGFGIYHWFTYGVIGDIALMAFVFIFTGIPGLVFAYAFEKTKSLALPFGLHLGWNFTNNTIFSKGSWHNDGILLPIEGVNDMQMILGMFPLNDFINLIFSNLLVPLLTFLILSYIYTNRKQEANNKEFLIK
jgi:uncharacterized protein